MRPVPAISSEQFGVFSTRQAAEAGWTPSALRHAVRIDALYVVRAGLLAVPPDLPSEWEQRLALARHAAAAAALAYPGASASHASAAVLAGLPVLAAPRRPCLTAGHRHAGTVPGVHLHRSRVAPRERARIGAIGLTSPARAALDLARERGVAAGLVVADAALRLQVADRNDLLLTAARAARRPRVAAARAVAEFADALAESPLESVSRLRIHECGLPPPDLQREIRVGGVFVRRLDFYWDAFGVGGEADGWEKYRADLAGLRREKRQQQALENAGLPVIRWGVEETRDFGRVAAQLAAAFRRGLPPSARRWEVRPPRPSPARV